MADLFSVTAPLAIRFPDGEKQIMIERLAYDDGLLFLPPFWTDMEIDKALRFVAGPIKGEGPWKVGDAVVSVLGCHGTDAELAGTFSYWQGRLSEMADRYPEKGAIAKLIKTHAAQAAHLDNCHPLFRGNGG